MIATSINQSKTLIELGIDVNTADMYYYNNDDIPQIISDIKSLKENINPKFYTLAWSLSALMELFDDKAGIAKEYETWFAYDNGKSHCSKHFNNPFDAAFEMVCYLLENKLI